MGIRIIERGYVYSVICDMMIGHVKIEGVKLGFYTTFL